MSIVTHLNIYYYPPTVPERTLFYIRGNVWKPDGTVIGPTSALVSVTVRDAGGAIIFQDSDTVYNGYYSTPVSAGLPAGSYAVQVSYAGDSAYAPCSATSTLTIKAYVTTHLSIYFSPATGILEGTSIGVRGNVWQPDETVIGPTAGTVAVTIKDQSGATVYSATGLVPYNGYYTTTLAAGLPKGSYSVQADYTGDSVYSPCTGTAPLPVLPSSATLSISCNLSGFNVTVNGAAKAVPYSEALPTGSYVIVAPSNLIVGSDTYNFTSWGDGPTTPTRTIALAADTSLSLLYQLQTPVPGRGTLEVHAFLDQQEVTAGGLVVETGEQFQTPASLPEDAGSYTVKVTHGSETKQLSATVASEQTVRLDFQFTTVTIPPGLAPVILVGVILGGAAILGGGGKKKR